MPFKIGFIGLGVMGKPMAKNLLRVHHELVVYNPSPGPVEELVKAGAQRGASPRDVAARADIIITMLPDGPEVEQVILGPGGVLEGARPGALVIDMSSISPTVARKVGAACEAKEVHFLDAPVSGGEPRAIHGTLAIMAGGRKEDFDRAEPVLKAMGSYLTLAGPVGAGNLTKLANQIMVAANIAAMGEALVLATKAGLDPEIVFEAVKGGLAGSSVLNFKAPMVIARNFKPGFRIRLHHKDLRNALQAAESMGIELPLTSLVQRMLASLLAEGKGDLDHSAIVQYLEQRAEVEVKRPG
ncbi:MAG: 2-hydroxy-3-oxopropionate reductase [Bryobacterales bacterium]|nr:2-hydroxy-3-oxopropionate reductase [Bryobacterales bacterium]